MSTSRLHAVRVGARDLDAAHRLWVELLGGDVLARQTDRLDVALPHGVIVSFAPTEGAPGVTGAELAVTDPETVAGRLQQAHGFPTRQVGDTWELDASTLVGTTVALVPEESSPVPDVRGGGAARVVAFDHLCFGVRDLPLAAAALRATGGTPVFGGDSPYGIRSLHLKYAIGKLELLSPLRDDSEVGRHLVRRGGPSPHHLTLLVQDVPTAEAAAHELGFDTTWTNLEHESWRDTYLRPGTTDGLVVQLAVTTRAYDAPLSDVDYRRVFEGYWWVAFHEMRPTAEVAP